MSAIAAVVARGVTLAATLAIVPLAIGYLGVERYGILMALISLTAMLVFADLGLGNGLLNIVSEAHGRDDRASARSAVSSAVFMLGGVAVLLGIGLIAAYPAVAWERLFATSDPGAAAEVGPTAAVLIALFLLALPLSTVDRVRLAYQEGYISSVAAIAGAVVTIVALLSAIALRASLPVLAMAIALPPVLFSFANGMRLFVRDRAWLRPRIAEVRGSTVWRLARIGFLFLTLQLAVAVAFQSDTVVAAAVLGPEAAATYSVTMRLFMIVPAIVATYLAMLWPAYSEALARGDVPWVKRTLRRSIVLAAGASSCASLVLVVIGPGIVRFLTGGAVDPPFGLVAGAGIWAVVYATFTAIAMLMNAASVIAYQVVVAAAMAVTSVALSVFLATIAGVSGIVWGTLIAYVVVAGVPILAYFPRLMHRVGAAGVRGVA